MTPAAAPSASPFDDDRLEADFEWLCSMETWCPLAECVVWDIPNPAQGTQREAALALAQRDEDGDPLIDILGLFGGNRSSKTYFAKMMVVAYALGGDHPAVQAFLALNDLPLDMIPAGPGETWMVARNSNDSINYHREDIAELLGELVTDKDWRGRESPGEASVKIRVPGYKKKAVIRFRAASQGKGAMQGTECRLIVFDEEPDDNEAWSQCEMRIGQEPVIMIICMTPIYGRRWAYKDIVLNASPRVRKIWIYTLDNPFLPPAARKQLKRKFAAMAPGKRRALAYGEFVVQEGLVYPEFSRARHVVRPFDIPEDWPRFEAFDFGAHTAAPFAALDPNTGILYVTRVYTGERLTTPSHHRAWRDIEKKAGEPAERWGDPAAATAQINDLGELGFYVTLADNTWSTGYDEVTERLMGLPLFETCETCNGVGCDVCDRTGEIMVGRGEAGIQFFEGTTEDAVEEIEGYIWDKSGERPVKKNDHVMDAVRYLCVGVKEWLETGRAHEGLAALGRLNEEFEQASPWEF